jgi:hypothetical protein
MTLVLETWGRRCKSAAVAAALALTPFAASAAIPAGFTPIFDGKSLNGWHISRNAHHGTDPKVFAKKGVLYVGQNPFGVGGILLTDKHYKNFELYLEANGDPGCDSGVFLRSSESGNAYQITLDDTGNKRDVGNLAGEARRISRGARNETDLWKIGEWNTMRIKVVGDDAPHITFWLNGVQVWDVQEDRSAYFTDVEGGSIALQSHFNASWPGGPSPRWVPDGLHRFRNIAIRELP